MRAGSCRLVCSIALLGASAAKAQDPITTPGSPSNNTLDNGCWSIADTQARTNCYDRRGKTATPAQKDAPKRSIRGVSTGLTSKEAQDAASRNGGSCSGVVFPDAIPSTKPKKPVTVCVFEDGSQLRFFLTKHEQIARIYQILYYYKVADFQQDHFSELEKGLDVEHEKDQDGKELPFLRLKSGEKVYFNCSLNNPWHAPGCFVSIKAEKIIEEDQSIPVQTRRSRIPPPRF